MHRLTFLFFALILSASCQDEWDENTVLFTSELELLEMDLDDYCEDLSQIARTSDKNKSNLEVRYGAFLRNQSLMLTSKYPIDGVPYDLLRNYTLMTKPGDALMSNDDFTKLVNFTNTNEEFSHIVHIDNGEADKMSKQEYLNHLATSRNLTSLQTAWSNWQENIARYQHDFPSILRLANVAAELNENYDVKAYWEYLLEYENAYEQAKAMWVEIEPLYQKLREFVLVRINQRYGSNFTDIPVYLTGSNFGEDWSNIADFILPHPQIHYDAQTYLAEKTVEDVYRLCEATQKKLGLGGFDGKFWLESKFNHTECLPKVLNFCSSQYTMILTCDKVGWSSYLTAHETSIEIGLQRQDYRALPRNQLRYSILDEALSNMGSIFALHNLPVYGVLESDIFTLHENSTENKLTAYLLVALRVLPKLSYYLTVDLWRLEELARPSGDLKRSWWELRKRYQGVEGVSNFELDFLGDSHVISNKPFLSKFLGVLLQFQILSYHQIRPFDEAVNLAERLFSESDFTAILRERNQKDSLNVMSYNYGIGEVSQFSLVDFFTPLLEYLESAPLEQIPIVQKHIPVEVIIPTEVSIDVPIEIEVSNETYTEEVSIQNDENLFVDRTSDETTKTDESSIGLYVGVTIGVCLLIVIVVVGFKKVVKRKPKTNNRRFET